MGSKYVHRQADGGANNVLYPDIGRAGMPYARNVYSEHRFESLPEPGLVFDALLKARDVSVVVSRLFRAMLIGGRTETSTSIGRFKSFIRICAISDVRVL